MRLGKRNDNCLTGPQRRKAAAYASTGAPAGVAPTHSVPPGIRCALAMFRCSACRDTSGSIDRSIDPFSHRQNVSLGQRSPIMRIFFFLFLCYFFSARYRPVDPKILRQNVSRGQRSPIMRIFFLSFFVLFFQCAVKYPSIHAASFEAPGKPRDY